MNYIKEGVMGRQIKEALIYEVDKVEWTDKKYSHQN